MQHQFSARLTLIAPGLRRQPASRLAFRDHGRIRHHKRPWDTPCWDCKPSKPYLSVLLQSSWLSLYLTGSADLFLLLQHHAYSLYLAATPTPPYVAVPDYDHFEDPVKKGRGASVDSQTLRRWLGQGHDDDGREVVMLDTRNTYETDIGTFKNAITLEIERFSEFPEAIAKAVAEQEDLKEKTVVSFCTGGIRCEKAVLYMNNIEMQRVYQLEGGILKYFEETGGEHWQGECFVFDDRVAVDASLNKTAKEYPRHIGPRDTMS